MFQSTRKKLTGGTHTLAYVKTENWQKKRGGGACQQKEDKNKE
jgi:hypothetical protein